MTRILSSIFFLVVLSLGLSACKDETTSPTGETTYKIGMVHWAAYSPLNVADVKGFWKEQDIDVEVINYATNTELNQALIDGKIDLALDMIGSWIDLHLQGKPIIVAGETDWSNGGDKIIVKNGVDVPSLKGSKMGVYLNMLSVKNFVAKYFATQGLAMSDVTLEEVSNTNDLSDKFIKSTYQIITNYDPGAAKAVASGDGLVASTSQDFPGCIPEGFAMHEDKPVPHADLVKIFKGWVKAVEWAMEPANKTEYFQIMRSKTFPGDDVADDAVLQQNLDQVKIHPKQEQKNINAAGGALETFVTDLLTFAKTNGFPNHTETKTHILETSAMREALQ